MADPVRPLTKSDRVWLVWHAQENSASDFQHMLLRYEETLKQEEARHRELRDAAQQLLDNPYDETHNDAGNVEHNMAHALLEQLLKERADEVPVVSGSGSGPVG